jgi:paraquat-inducible protein B
MNESTNPSPEKELPKAKVKERRWRFSVVWIVPFVAAIVAGYLVFQRVREFGPKLTIAFHDVSGVRAGETTVQYRGVVVGEVKSLSLRADRKVALVTLRFKRWAASLAREQTQFWIVRPQFQGGSVTGLGTIVAGPYIEIRPGEGNEQFEFTGLEEAPASAEGGGLKIVLLSAHLGAVKSGSPVYYRGIEVGIVEGRELSTNAQTVETRALIQKRYANLVREGSKFWNVSGIDVKLGLFRGAEINVESLRSVWAGGVSFVTPSEPGNTITNGAVFSLYDEPKKEWLEWSPRIAIIPEEDTSHPISEKQEGTATRPSPVKDVRSD